MWLHKYCAFLGGNLRGFLSLNKNLICSVGITPVFFKLVRLNKVWVAGEWIGMLRVLFSRHRSIGRSSCPLKRHQLPSFQELHPSLPLDTTTPLGDLL